jgi:hypothetical protein
MAAFRLIPEIDAGGGMIIRPALALVFLLAAGVAGGSLRAQHSDTFTAADRHE